MYAILKIKNVLKNIKNISFNMLYYIIGSKIFVYISKVNVIMLEFVPQYCLNPYNCLFNFCSLTLKISQCLVLQCLN